jgi:hypothetical protein
VPAQGDRHEAGSKEDAMDTDVTFLDCPAYMDKHGTARCGLPAVVEYRYTIRSVERVLDAVKIRCPRGHWFNGPVEALTVAQTPSAIVQAAAR